MWFSAIRLAVLAVLAFNLASILAQSAENECVEIRDFTNKSCEVCGELKTPCRIYKPTGCNICPPASKTTSKMASKTTSNDHKLTSDSPRLNLSTENFDFEVDTSNMTTKDHSILVKVQNHFSLVNILTGSGVTVAVVLSAIFAYLKREVIKAFITRAIRFFKKDADDIYTDVARMFDAETAKYEAKSDLKTDNADSAIILIESDSNDEDYVPPKTKRGRSTSRGRGRGRGQSKKRAAK